jgi:hypothetical protein
MNIDSLIDKIVKDHNKSDYELCLKLISNIKLYFFVIDDGTFSAVDEIVFSGKDRPVSLPIIKDNCKNISVLYTSKELALKHIQKGFRVSYTIKGIDAIKFQYSSKDVNEIVLQGNNGHVCLGACPRMPFCPNSALFPKNNAPVSEARDSEILTI